MPRRAELYEAAKGSLVEGYFLLKSQGGNVPPKWFERATKSRQNRHESVARALKSANWGEIIALRDWEEAYFKERFYYGIRVLLELERSGKTDL